MIDTPGTFLLPEDVVNRALQRIGVLRISSFYDNSKAAYEAKFLYDKLRRAELRRNTWVFTTRKTALRPMVANSTLAGGTNTGTLLLQPAAWDMGTTYTPGAIVADPNVAGLLWTSLAQENVGNPPGSSTIWDVYFGTLAVQPFDSTQGYWPGELVYIQNPATLAVNVYRSLTNDVMSLTTGPLTSPATATPWTVTGTYNRDQVVTDGTTLYRSAIEQNVGQALSSAAWLSCGPLSAPTLALLSDINWLPITATVRSFTMAYPIGSGPVQEANTRNAFRLPNGYLRQAAQDPTQGAVSYLGAPSGLTYNDWQFEGEFLTSYESGAILLRFIADITNVAKMDDMFCEGLAARLALELGPILVPDMPSTKLVLLQRAYDKVMGEARIVNAIESGSDQPPEDDYISCRM